MAYDLSSLAHLKQREGTLKKKLQARMEDLADDLAKAAERLKAGRLPDFIGIVQGRGSEIDRLCGCLYELAEQRKYMEAEQAVQEVSDGTGAG